jgi:shikimate kinase
MNQRIFLLGAMGSGKTRIGTILSENLGLPYIDNDYGLSKMISKSMNELAELEVADLHGYEDSYAQQLFSQPGPYIAGLAASIADNFELSEKLKGFHAIYLHTTLQAQLLHSGRRGVGRQGLLINRDDEIRSRYERRDSRFRAISTLVVNCTRDRQRDAEVILELLEINP